MRVYFSTPDIARLAKEHMLVDMHFHSKYSQDSGTQVEDIVDRARKLGIMVALTDHNSIGGVLHAHRIAPGVVRPGIEICSAEGKDVIAYFYSIAELEDFYTRIIKPRLRNKTSIGHNTTSLRMDELLDELRRCNCVISLPHPFAVPPRRSYKFFQLAQNRPLLRHVHAIEVINQTMIHKQNLAAVGWAMQYDKSMVGGSDGHILAPLGSALTVCKAATWEEFLDEVKAKRVAVIGEERKVKHQLLTTENFVFIKEKMRIIKNMNKERK